jgi:hypothetical protein
MTPIEEIKSEVADLFHRRETAGVDGMQMKIYYIWTSQIARKLEEYVCLLEAEIKFLHRDNSVKAEIIGNLMLENKELSKRDRLLSNLEAAGVDNWEGFSDCVDETEGEDDDDTA